MDHYLVLVANPETTAQLNAAFESTVVVPSTILAVGLNYSPVSTEPYANNRTLQGLRSLGPGGDIAQFDIAHLTPLALNAPISLTCVGLIDVYDSNPSALVGREQALTTDGDSITVAVFKPSAAISSMRRYLDLKDTNDTGRYVPHAVAVPMPIVSAPAQAATRAASSYLNGRVFVFDSVMSSTYRPYLGDTDSAMTASNSLL